jgi:hypothetical protein
MKAWSTPDSYGQNSDVGSKLALTDASGTMVEWILWPESALPSAKISRFFRSRPELNRLGWKEVFVIGQTRQLR